MILDTSRLAASPLDPSDLRDLCRLHEDRQVMEFVGGVRTEEQTQQWLRENLRHWTDHGFGIWTFRDQSDGAFVGRAGLRRVQLDGAEEIELAYSLMPSYWGRGLAFEMASAMLALGFEHLALENVIAMIDPGNAKSRRLAERLSFQFQREAAWKGAPAMLYRKPAPCLS